eukprot:2473935-Karenia_brevis.AAC.1
MDDLSDSASDTAWSDDGDLWSMTSREETTLSNLYKECPRMQWLLATKKLAACFRNDPLLPLNSKDNQVVDVAMVDSGISFPK